MHWKGKTQGPVLGRAGRGGGQDGEFCREERSPEPEGEQSW